MSKYIANSFQVPNAIVDEVMSKVSGNAFKCYMLIVRKTTGWNKVSDRIATTLFIEKTGIGKKPTVYKALGELEALNLVVSEKKRGQINNYRLNFDLLTQYPEEVVPQKDTSTQKGYPVVPQKDTPSSTPKGYPTKHTIKHTKTKHTNSAPDAPLSLLLSHGVSDQLAKDWLLVRKSKRAATLTQTALDGLIREASKANLTIEQAITVCIERNWVSLNHKWLLNDSGSKYKAAAFDPVAYINKNRISKQGDNHDSIDGDYKRVG